MNVFDGLVDLALGLVPGGRFHQAQVQSCLPSLRGNLEHVVFARIDAPSFQTLRASGEFLHECFQLRCPWCVADGWFLALQLGSRQVEHRGGLHVGSLAKHLHEFRHVDESGEPGVEPIARAVRGKLHRCDWFAESRRPRVEMMEVMLLQIPRLKIPLHREHLGHAVGDGCARGQDHAPAAIERLDVPHLQIHVEGPLAGSLRQAGDARHLGNVKQIFEVLRFVHEQAIHAEFLESQRVVLLVLRGEGLQASLQSLLCPLDFLHQPAIRRVRVLAFDHFQLVKLFLEETFLRFACQRDAFETGVRDDDGIPIAGGDAAEQLLAVLRLEIYFARDQDVRAGIKREQFGRELAEHVVGHGEHRLAGETKPL